ncbi:hypothetical protein Hdeb2414_s0027g00691811 [Helianthus debilis subsp. tardiflorus]
MEDDEGGRIKAAQVEGGKQEEEDLVVENQSSSASAAAATAASSSALKRKHPHEDLVENPSSASAPAAAGTKSQVEQGAKRPCVEKEEETTKPNHTVMDETEDEEEEEEEELIYYGEPRMKDGGYYLRFEADRAIIVGERPEPVVRSLGRPHPNALTFKRMERRLAETGLGYLHPDDPLGKIPWNPFPFPVGEDGFSFYGSDT